MNNNYKTKQTVYIIFDRNDSSVSSFKSYLVAALKRQRIDVVFDKTGPEQENDRFVGIKLILVIFSVLHKFSVVCLENLIKLHEFLQEKGHMVVPVFYDVSVSAIKDQMERCEASAVHENSFSLDQATKWRRALVQRLQTMKLQGHEYNDEQREESEFIEKIVQDVSEKLYPTEHIGVHNVLPELENLLCLQPWGRRTLAIFGKRGIGKTTLVKAAFRKMLSGYDAKHFIRVRNEKITELLSDEDFKEIEMEKFDLNNQDAQPCHRSKRVLIVLDDVRSARDAEAFLGEFDRFGPGSLLIITSRHRKILEQFHVNAIYELKGLNSEDSLKLFTRCFFGEDVTDEERLKFSAREIESCDGNPSDIRSCVERRKRMKTINMEPALGRISHDSFSYTKNFTITMKQHFSFTTTQNYQYGLEKFLALDTASLIFEYMLSNLGAPNLNFNFMQQSFLCATSHSYLSDLKDLPLLYLSSHVLESLSSDLRIPHCGQKSVLNKSRERYKSFQIDDFEKHFSSEASKTDCTNILVKDQLELPQILNLRGCIEIIHLQEFKRTIREWKLEGKILQCRLQKGDICPHCKSANETGSHLYFDITFWSILTTISNRIQSWEVVLFALLNLTGAKAKDILCRMEWQLTVYSRWFKRNHRLFRQSYRSSQVHRFIRNIILIVRKSSLKISSGIP